MAVSQTVRLVLEVLGTREGSERVRLLGGIIDELREEAQRPVELAGLGIQDMQRSAREAQSAVATALDQVRADVARGVGPLPPISFEQFNAARDELTGTSSQIKGIVDKLFDDLEGDVLRAQSLDFRLIDPDTVADTEELAGRIEGLRDRIFGDLGEQKNLELIPPEAAIEAFETEQKLAQVTDKLFGDEAKLAEATDQTAQAQREAAKAAKELSASRSGVAGGSGGTGPTVDPVPDDVPGKVKRTAEESKRLNLIMIDASRGAQDLAFGFRAVINNVDPLVLNTRRYLEAAAAAAGGVDKLNIAQRGLYRTIGSAGPLLLLVNVLFTIGALTDVFDPLIDKAKAFLEAIKGARSEAEKLAEELKGTSEEFVRLDNSVDFAQARAQYDALGKSIDRVKEKIEEQKLLEETGDPSVEISVRERLSLNPFADSDEVKEFEEQIERLETIRAAYGESVTKFGQIEFVLDLGDPNLVTDYLQSVLDDFDTFAADTLELRERASDGNIEIVRESAQAQYEAEISELDRTLSDVGEIYTLIQRKVREKQEAMTKIVEEEARARAAAEIAGLEGDLSRLDQFAQDSDDRRDALAEAREARVRRAEEQAERKRERARQKADRDAEKRAREAERAAQDALNAAREVEDAEASARAALARARSNGVEEQVIALRTAYAEEVRALNRQVQDFKESEALRLRLRRANNTKIQALERELAEQIRDIYGQITRDVSDVLDEATEAQIGILYTGADRDSRLLQAETDRIEKELGRRLEDSEAFGEERVVLELATQAIIQAAREETAKETARLFREEEARYEDYVEQTTRQAEDLDLAQGTARYQDVLTRRLDRARYAAEAVVGINEDEVARRREFQQEAADLEIRLTEFVADQAEQRELFAIQARAEIEQIQQRARGLDLRNLFSTEGAEAGIANLARQRDAYAALADSYEDGSERQQDALRDVYDTQVEILRAEQDLFEQRAAIIERYYDRAISAAIGAYENDREISRAQETLTKIGFDKRRDAAKEAYDAGTSDAREYHATLARLAEERTDYEKELEVSRRGVIETVARELTDLLIQEGLKRVTAFIAQETAKLIFGTTSAATATAATVAAMKAVTAAATPAATATAIASFGAAGAAGAASVIAALAATKAAYGAGSLFAEGGYTGSGGKYQEAGTVHRGEFVFTQEAVKGDPRPFYALMRALERGQVDPGQLMVSLDLMDYRGPLRTAGYEFYEGGYFDPADSLPTVEFVAAASGSEGRQLASLSERVDGLVEALTGDESALNVQLNVGRRAQSEFVQGGTRENNRKKVRNQYKRS